MICSSLILEKKKKLFIKKKNQRELIQVPYTKILFRRNRSGLKTWRVAKSFLVSADQILFPFKYPGAVLSNVAMIMKIIKVLASCILHNIPFLTLKIKLFIVQIHMSNAVYMSVILLTKRESIDSCWICTASLSKHSNYTASQAVQ